MSDMNIRKGDKVKIIAGNDRGKTAKVLAAFPRERRIVAEGMNIKKKHVRPRAAGRKGELVTIPMPFPVSRAMLVCPSCGKATRPRSTRDSRGARSRACRSCGSTI